MIRRSLAVAIFPILMMGAHASATAEENLSPAAKQWWADVSFIASDANEGRQTGSAGYMRAADYVISRMKAQGLKPAGDNGFLQQVTFEQQVVDQDASRAMLVNADGSQSPLKVGDALLKSRPGGEARPVSVDAPLVFVGYGLGLPKQGYDDFAGLDLKGKIAVVISGGPDNISAPIKSDARANRASELAKLGAMGVIALTTPHQVEILWSRQRLIAHQAGMYLADAKFHAVPDGFFTATADPDQTEAFFKDSGHSFAEMSALSDASKPVPRFELKPRFKAMVAATRTTLTSPNLIAKLEGRDSKLKSDYVAVSAHLDHLGIGEPINGKRLYNGAMDDASGVAHGHSISPIASPAGPGRAAPFCSRYSRRKKKACWGRTISLPIPQCRKPTSLPISISTCRCRFGPLKWSICRAKPKARWERTPGRLGFSKASRWCRTPIPIAMSLSGPTSTASYAKACRRCS